MNKASELPESASPGEPDAHEDCARPACKAAGRPKASELEARTRNLVLTAGQLFLRHGYGNVSLETIAREAHVAVRTIYVKFGGKAGLLKAAINANRERFYSIHDLENDTRSLRESITEFAEHFIDMITAPEALRMKRMMVAEAGANPDMIEAFMTSGPDQTRAMLLRFFSRPESLAQMRDGLPLEQLPTFFISAIIGDQFTHLVDPSAARIAEIRSTMPARLQLFFLAILRDSTL
jgi:AcrR family transcriptional regulator